MEKRVVALRSLEAAAPGAQGTCKRVKGAITVAAGLCTLRSEAASRAACRPVLAPMCCIWVTLGTQEQLSGGWMELLLCSVMKLTKLTLIYYPSLTLDVVSLQWPPEFQNSCVREIVWVWLLPTWGTASWCFLCCISLGSSNILKFNRCLLTSQVIYNFPLFYTIKIHLRDHCIRAQRFLWVEF